MLEWMLILDVACLAIFLFLLGLALLIAGRDRSDPFRAFAVTFWDTFLFPPVPMEIDEKRISSRPLAPRSEEPAESAEPSKDDALYGRTKRDRDGRIITASLDVVVVPHGPEDKVLGAEGGALRLQVSGEPGEGRTNKAVIDLVAQAIGVKAYQVTITKGHYHARKGVSIQGLRPDELQARMGNLT